MMAEYVRPSYLEELSLPLQRLPDYVPAARLAIAVEPPAAAAVAEQPAVAPDAVPAGAATEQPSPVALMEPPVAAASDAPVEATTAAELVEVSASPAPGQTIKLSGRISSAVHVVERRGSTAVSFSLVETDTAGTPRTHRVYATKQFAERLAKQQLSQGMTVEVAGQPQPREEKQPDGSTRPVAYLYCFGVRVLAATSA